MNKRRIQLIAVLCLSAVFHLGCEVGPVEIGGLPIETPSSDTGDGEQVPPINDNDAPADDNDPPAGNDPTPDDDTPDSDPPAEDRVADAMADAEEFLSAKVLTRVRSSNNGTPGEFFEFFQSELELCSNKSFHYRQVQETTILGNTSREEFEGRGTWSIRVDEQTLAVFLVVTFTEVSEGELITAELVITQNSAGQTFLNGERANVTDGDDLCD